MSTPQIKHQLYSTFPFVMMAMALVIAIVMIVLLNNKEYKQHREFWGPNPARVEWKTDYGNTGFMLVRDVDRAEEEVRAQIADSYKTLQENPNIDIKGNIPTDYKFVKFEVTR